MSYLQGDLILIPYPYSDLSNSKRRPAIIISKNGLNPNNYIVSKVTSVLKCNKNDYFIGPDDLNGFELDEDSEVRTDEIFTVHKSIIVKKIASFTSDALKKIIEMVADNISVK